MDPSLNRAIGHAKVLSVNGGDVVSIDTKYYFTSGSFVQPASIVVQDVLTQLASIFFPGFGTSGISGEEQIKAETMFTQNVPFTDFLSSLFSESLNNYSDKPLAFLTYIMLDKEFNMIPEATGVLRAENPDQLSDLAVLELKIPKDGFLYIYVSNQSTGKKVSFDNLDIKHVPGNVLEENHYYPYGLLIEQLSSKNPNFVSQSNQKYQSKPLRDELSMNMLDFGARQYDAVLGRWIVQDPMRQYSNPYVAMGNNPSNMVDPSGMSAYTPTGHAGVYSFGYTADATMGGGGGYGDNTDVNGSQIQPSGDTRVWYDPNSNTYFKGNQPISQEEAVSYYENKFGSNNKFSTKWTIEYEFIYKNQEIEKGALADGIYTITLTEPMMVPSIVIDEGGMAQSGGGGWDNSKLALDIGGGIYGALQTTVRPGDQWLGKNGKYYNNSWGGNQYTGGRSGAFKAASAYKWAGRATVGVSVLIGVAETVNGYQMDGGQFDYNAQSAAFGTTGSLLGGWAGAEAGAAAGAAIGVWFGGVGAVPGAIIGGFIGGFCGGYFGGNIGSGAVNYYHGR